MSAILGLVEISHAIQPYSVEGCEHQEVGDFGGQGDYGCAGLEAIVWEPLL